MHIYYCQRTVSHYLFFFYIRTAKNNSKIYYNAKIKDDIVNTASLSLLGTITSLSNKKDTILKSCFFV